MIRGTVLYMQRSIINELTNVCLVIPFGSRLSY